jgi:hypothetical protein
LREAGFRLLTEFARAVLGAQLIADPFRYGQSQHGYDDDEDAVDADLGCIVESEEHIDPIGGSRQEDDEDPRE